MRPSSIAPSSLEIHTGCDTQGQRPATVPSPIGNSNRCNAAVVTIFAPFTSAIQEGHNADVYTYFAVDGTKRNTGQYSLAQQPATDSSA